MEKHKWTREDALLLLDEFNQEESHMTHALTVGYVMRHFADLYSGDPDLWEITGLIHDLDYEKFPDEHCVKTGEILEERGWPDDIIRAAVSHGYPSCTDIEPLTDMEKVLYTIDELTGLVYAAALMRPTRMEGMSLKSLKKKWKDKSFAAGVNRELITTGAEKLGMPLDEVMLQTIEAMGKVAEEIGLIA